VKKFIYNKNSLDLMFIIDCTGSMSAWINASKDEITSIIEYVRTQNYGIQIRVSIVAYRDIRDSKRFEVLPFTEDTALPKKFISGLVADGGDDGPEDIAGGFKLALEQEWLAKARYAILIADAPCHGR
jgi:vacuole morphology and inheritance protein 14